MVVAAKAPQAVFCLLTALQFHGLTTQLPRQIWIAMPRGSHAPRIDWPPIRMVQMTGDAHAAGIEEHLRDCVTLRVYSAAKTVVDCFKHRNKIGLDVALEALKDAWRARKASVDDLWLRYAKVCRVANVMLPYMEVVAHEQIDAQAVGGSESHGLQRDCCAPCIDHRGRLPRIVQRPNDWRRSQ